MTLLNNSATQACTEDYYEITANDLPLCCPLPQDRLWDAHPRVYLPIEKKGSVECPYCSAVYILKKDNC